MTPLEKLSKIYEDHGKIIIGLDFDDTIFALDKDNEEMCKRVRNLILSCKAFSTICLYTISDPQSIKYKVELMKLWGIEPDYINESPVKLGDGRKPYFNILLDDKSGLKESYELLRKFQYKL